MGMLTVRPGGNVRSRQLDMQVGNLGSKERSVLENGT